KASCASGAPGVSTFFFRAEDGIRDLTVTGVQTCALPIFRTVRKPCPELPWIANCPNALDLSVYPVHPHKGDYLLFLGRMSPDKRSEERRVGKECRSGAEPSH